MNIQGNLIIFSTDNEERKDVRKLKEKKLQILIDENNDFPKFKIKDNEYIKRTAESRVEELFNTSEFYIEQLYTWGNPLYYTKSIGLTVTYLVIINKKNLKSMPDNMKFYDINIENIDTENVRNIVLSNDYKEIRYKIETLVKRDRENLEYIHRLIGKAEITEFNAVIIHMAIKRLRNRIENTNIAFSFLDKEFTMSELQQIYEIILDTKLVSANFRKKIEPMVKRTNKIVKQSAYRPSYMYTFNEKYIRSWI